MYQTKNRKLRPAIALLLVLSMLLGMLPTAFAVEPTLNYVSLGDSMANGYGFDGYYQTSDDRNVYDFMTGKGMYGAGAYPNQFAAYLTEQGYNVNHTKLAASAMLAEDLLYLLGGREEFNDGWNGYKDYVGTYTDGELMSHIQSSVADADIITMGIGNASFGAFMMQKVTDALGIFGASLDVKVDFANAIEVLELDSEQYALVMQVYNELETRLVKMVPAQLVAQYNLEDVVDILAYTATSYIVNYKLLIEKILEMNPDVELVLVGLMNTTYGMNVTDANGNVILPFGDVMDRLFDVLNAYMAGLPVALQAQGTAKEAKLYYAEQPAPLYICQQFEELLNNNWGDIQNNRLSGTTIRERNIDAYNNDLAAMIGQAVTGNALPKITLNDVWAYENLDWEGLEQAGWSPWAAFQFAGYNTGNRDPIDTILSVAIYLAIEEAVAKSTDTMNIPLSGLLKIAGDLSSVFADLGTPPTASPELSRQWLLEGLTTPELKGMCKIYGLFKVGNGMSVHPTPEGHDNIAASVISAYANQYTAADHIKDTLLEAAETLKNLAIAHGPEALLALEQYVVNSGWMTEQELALLKTIISETIYAFQTQPEETAKQMCTEIVTYLYQAAVAHGIINEAEVRVVLGWINEAVSYLTETNPDQIKSDATALLTKFWNEKIAPYIDIDTALVQQFADDVKALIDLINNTPEDYLDQVIDAFLNELNTKYASLIYDATHAEYTPDASSAYLALGGYTAAGGNATYPALPYYALVGEALELDSFKSAGNIGGLLPSGIAPYISANAQDIAASDLITYQLDASSFIMAALQETPDWSRYLSAEELAFFETMKPVVKEILYADWTQYADMDTALVTSRIRDAVIMALPAELQIPQSAIGLAENTIDSLLSLCVTYAKTAAEIAQSEKTNLLNQYNALDDATVALVSDLAERLVYSVTAYAIDTIKAMETIQALNPEAKVLLVGMYNPLSGLKIVVNGTEIDAGAMAETAIEATNLYHMAYAVLDGNVKFVDVSDAQTDGFSSADTIYVDNLNVGALAAVLMNMVPRMHANAAGHQYIYEQIMGALVPEETVLYGDADGNGLVEAYDATLVLKYTVKLIGDSDLDLAAADADGDGVVTAYDASLILKYTVRLITQFPAEKA